MARILLASGLEVRHEDMGKDGTVSCFFAVDDYYYHGRHHDRLAVCEFDVRLYQTREPLATIGSLTEFHKTWFWHWQQKHTGISGDEEPLTRAARFYDAWSDLCEAAQNDLQYRIEDLDAAWPRISDLLGLSIEHPPIPVTEKNIGASDHIEVTWDDLKSVSPLLYTRTRQRAERYGYQE
jgi:hypothetical protein